MPPSTGWWFLVPLLTFGLGAPAMVLAGGIKLRSLTHKICAAGYFAAQLTMCAVSSATSAQNETAGWGVLVALLYFAVWFGGTVHTAVLQTRVRDQFFRMFPAQPSPSSSPGPGPVPGRAAPRPGLTGPPRTAWQHGTGVDPALAAAQWRAARRQEARQLQAGEPAMAAELMIGRPDLPGRQYDDGGLVDVNHVPVEWLMRMLSLQRPVAEQIIAAREAHNGLTTPEELIVYCDGLTPAKLETFRDRLIFIPR